MNQPAGEVTYIRDKHRTIASQCRSPGLHRMEIRALMAPYTVCSDLNMSAQAQCRLNKNVEEGLVNLIVYRCLLIRGKEILFGPHALKSISWHSKVRAGA